MMTCGFITNIKFMCNVGVIGFIIDLGSITFRHCYDHNMISTASIIVIQSLLIWFCTRFIHIRWSTTLHSMFSRTIFNCALSCCVVIVVSETTTGHGIEAFYDEKEDEEDDGIYNDNETSTNLLLNEDAVAA